MSDAAPNPQSAIRVGFIGAGWTERIQIPTYRLAGLTAQAICASRPENAKRVATNLEIPEVYNSWQELLRSDTIDLVSIVTPPHLHAEIAIATLRAGKHVICEKPTALNVAEAENMFAAAQAVPNQLAIIDHELRFHPQRAHLRRLAREGYIGNPLYIELDSLYSRQLDREKPWSWHSNADQGGGSLGALGSHLIDLARWLVGRIDGLSAQLQTGHFLRPDPQGNGSRRVSSDDAAHLMLQFGSAVQGRIAVNDLYPSDRGMSVLMVGTEGALKIDNEDRLWGIKSGEYAGEKWQELTVADETAELPLPNRRPFTIGCYYLGKTLNEVLSRGQTVVPEAASFYDGLVVQRVLDAARRSHRERTWVRL
ncbi:MAG: Gfo/Idh/MocA family oxidoreductase [Caldilineaceae bacterium]|nr:Gfo/Idh/MocA family oxidoreductase [Caldilineaceae bacterium]